MEGRGHFLRRAVVNHERSYSVLSASRPVFEPAASEYKLEMLPVEPPYSENALSATSLYGLTVPPLMCELIATLATLLISCRLSCGAEATIKR
jgi:hypothetical protein